MIKELKHGDVHELMDCGEVCEYFMSMNEYVVVFTSSFRVKIFKHLQLVHEMKSRWANYPLAHAAAHCIRFVDDRRRLLEVHFDTFDEVCIRRQVWMFFDSQGDAGIVSLFADGFLQTDCGQMRLLEVFPKMPHCNWTCLSQVDHVQAVAAGNSQTDPLTGDKLSKRANFFALIRFEEPIEVLNEQLLQVDWFEYGSMIITC